MDRTELKDELIKFCLDHNIHTARSGYLLGLFEKYNQSNIKTMDNPDQEEGTRPERPDDDGEG